jgi:hypothetical protein
MCRKCDEIRRATLAIYDRLAANIRRNQKFKYSKATLRPSKETEPKKQDIKDDKA